MKDGDKIKVPVTFERDESYRFMALMQEWVSGDNGRGVSFELTSGAGVGSPFMILRVEFPDGTVIREVANVAPMVTDMVSRIVTEHDAAEPSKASEVTA